VDQDALVGVVALPGVVDLVANLGIARQRTAGRLGVDRVEAGGRLGRVEQLGGAQVAHVQKVGDALDVAEEAHAAEGAVVLGLERAVEGDDDHHGEHDALQGARDALALHVAVAL